MLTWTNGKPCNGVLYYREAVHAKSKFTVCRCHVMGVPVYSLYKDKEFIEAFWPDDGGSAAAMSKAEELTK